MNTGRWLSRIGLATVLIGLWAGAAEASPRTGLSLGLGVGGMTATDEDSYMGIGDDVYFEGQLVFDVGPVNIGLSAGYLYRKLEEYGYYRYGRYYGSYYREYTMAFVPVELKVCLLPVRFAKPDFPVQPYIGIGVGALVPVGDNEDTYAMVSPQAGIEFQLGRWNVLGLAVAYHVVIGEDDDYDDFDLDYTTAMLVYRFRIPFASSASQGTQW